MNELKELKSILKKYKISPKKELGQHFIKNWNLLKRELKYANINKNDTVLEIGPGIGNLTELLAQKAKKVIAIEVDPQFRKCLTDLQKRYSNIKIIFGDALQVKFPHFDKVVSNLPFKVALPVTFKLLEHNFELAILLYQKRQAKRICAKPGQRGYSRISISIYRNGNAKILEFVRKNTFYPQPDVDCALVKITKTKPKFEIPSEEFFKRVLDFLFLPKTQSGRQAILNLRYTKNPKKKVNEVLSELRQIQKKKVYQLTPKQFGKITELLHKKKIKIPEIPEELKRKVQKFKRPVQLLRRYR